jgi:hypothetical protein
VSIKTNKGAKLFTSNRFSFKDIVLVNRWFLKENITTPCFCMFFNENNLPLIFSSLSEKKVKTWITQLNLYCSKMAYLNGFETSVENNTCVDVHGFAYYFFFKPNTPPFFKNIGRKTFT